MKKIIITVVFFVLMSFNSCKENLKTDIPNIPEKQSECEILYMGLDYKIVRIKIEGRNYLVNSNGGIIKE